MSELMGDIRAEPKPGTALKTMIREHRHLDEFMAMVKAKMELDKKYLNGLKTIRDSWNPEWHESGAWPLISPLLTHISNEIDEREKTATEVESCLTALPSASPPNAFPEDGYDPLEMLENVEIRYHQYEHCHKIIRTPDSVHELDLWLRQADSARSWVDPYISALPTREREYRRSVVAQQTAVRNAVKWQAENLPGVLERHQQRAEDVKSFLNVLFIYYSSIHSSLSVSSSAALSFNGAFSSSEFIAPRHDEAEDEAFHALLQDVVYCNYMRNGEVPQPIFGLGVEMTVSFVNELLNYPTKVTYFPLYNISSAFELEKAATGSAVSALLESLSKGPEDQLWIQRYILCAFLMDEPLLPLPENVITQYQDGISRAKLSSLMAAYLSLARQEVVTLVVRLVGIMIARTPGRSTEPIWKVMGIFLSHNHAAAPIIESIWRKWDIVNDRPFPEGVERRQGLYGGKSQVLWKKTGSPYYTSILNSSV